MADIGKCSGQGCPLKEKCYRYTATPTHEYVQSRIMPPFIIDKGLFKCSMYYGSSVDLLYKQLTGIVEGKTIKN